MKRKLCLYKKEDCTYGRSGFADHEGLCWEIVDLSRAADWALHLAVACWTR